MTDTGGIDERARLEAIVYGRPSTTDAERAEATAALRALVARPAVARTVVAPSAVTDPSESDRTAETEPTGPWVPLALPRKRRRLRAVTAVLAGIALIAAIAGSPTPTAFADSMGVFERPQTDGDVAATAEHGNLPGAGPELDLSTVRLIEEPADGVVVLAYRTVSADVCIAIMVGGGGGGSCVNEADFRTGGLQGGTLFPPSDWRYEWGPWGDPVISGPDESAG